MWFFLRAFRTVPVLMRSTRTVSCTPLALSEEERDAPPRPAHAPATHTPRRAPRDPRGSHGLRCLAGVAAPAERHGPEGRPSRPDDLGPAFHPDPAVVRSGGDRGLTHPHHRPL